jgi:prolyl 4-hydroxylase
MWRADYYGQQHWVTTRETHFVTLPDEKELGPIQEVGSARVLKENDARILQEYRSPEPVLNMTMTVLSCAPRAFEIKEFLSQAEVDHIMYLTTGMKLHRSTTAGANGQLTKEDLERDDTRNTRTSLNTWVYREKDAIIDTIYRRAADLLRIDEALLRPRGPEEQVQLKSKRSLAEALQLVHYDVGQEYTAHHGELNVYIGIIC